MEIQIDEPTLEEVSITQTTTYEVVGDEYRRISKENVDPDPIMAELLKGSTLKVTNLGNSAKYYRWAKTCNKQLHLRKFKEFTIMWAEDI